VFSQRSIATLMNGASFILIQYPLCPLGRLTRVDAKASQPSARAPSDARFVAVLTRLQLDSHD